MSAGLAHRGVHTLVRTTDWESVTASIALLHGEPTVRDAESGWAQYDSPTGRVLVERTGADLAGTYLMVKVDNVSQARTALLEQGLDVGEVRNGAHELLVEALASGGLALVVYEPSAQP